MIAQQVDPIEKKPLFHLLPGSSSYSVATVGCNFRCIHCQNYNISQPVEESVANSGSFVEPEEVVARAVAAGCSSISYTYTEPTIFFEYAFEIAKLAKAAGLKNVFVSNGYITNEALVAISPFLDAANIDLKGYSESFYREVTGASLAEVLDCLRQYKRLGIWLEITTLVIPQLNDSDEQLRGIAQFIAAELGSQTPWHVSRFHPTYKLTAKPPTPAACLKRAQVFGQEAGLRYVYVGNIPGEGGEDSCCPGCGATLILRYNYTVEKNLLANGHCPTCGFWIDGIWE
jgi:pyruvate formate lyase activating enzyme